MNENGVTTGWVVTHIIDIADINPRYSFDKETRDIPVSFVPMRCVEEQTGRIDLSCTKKLSEVRKGYTYFADGDLLFAKITPCMENGKIAIANGLMNGLGFGSTEFHVLRSPESILTRMLFYFLLQDSVRRDARKGMTGSAGQLRVPARFLEDLEFPLPPLPEQRRIVAKIEELFSDLDAGVEALKKVKVELKRYRQAVLKAAVEGKLTEEWRLRQGDLERGRRGDAGTGRQSEGSVHDILERIKGRTENGERKKGRSLPPIDKTALPELPEGWEWTQVGGIADSMKNGIYKEKHFYSDDGTACLRMYNIVNGVIVWKDIKRMSLTRGEVEEYALRPGDILVNRVNSRELVGKAAAIPEGLEPCVYESKNIRLRLVPGIAESRYIGYSFQVFGQQHFNFNAQQVVGMASINQSQLAALSFPLPPLVEQEQIVSEVEKRLSAADEVEKTVEASLKQADRLRQSILKRAFEGKLVPQDPRDEPASELLGRIRREKESQKLIGLEAKKMRRSKDKRGLN